MLDDLSFSLKAGDILHIQGDNGIGKTSLLRCLAGLSSVDAGDIQYDFDLSLQRLFIGHQAGVKQSLTVQENVDFFLGLAGACKRAAVDTALQSLSLSAFRDDLCAHLSSGQNRRVALSRLFFEDKLLWCLDEPFTALDTHAASVIAERINAHSAEGGMVIFTSHQAMPLQSPNLKSLRLGVSA